VRYVERDNEIHLADGIFGRTSEIKYAGKSYTTQGFRIEYRQDDLKQSLLQECLLWSKIRHPNVVQFIGVWYRESDKFPEIVTEMVQRQFSLRSLMADCHGNRVSKINLLSMIGDVSLGLQYLHIQNPPIVHCGVVPDNVMLQFSSCDHCFCLQAAKITNVGVAKVMKLSDNSLSSEQRSAYLPFIPPEGKIDNPQFGPSFDIFAFGSLIWYSTVTQILPEQPEISQDPNDVELQHTKLQDNLNITPEDCKCLSSLVGDCWKEIPNERPTIVDIFEGIKKVIHSQNVQISKVRQYCNLSVSTYIGYISIAVASN